LRFKLRVETKILEMSRKFKEACQMDSDQTWILNVFEVLGKGSSGSCPPEGFTTAGA
jgi:hypothetical protein